MMKIINLFGCVIFSLMVGVCASITLHENGFQTLALFGPFLIGMFLPKVMFEWIYKEEIEESKSQEDEEQ